MPIVRIDIHAGKTTVYKRALLRGVREGMMVALDLPGERIMQRVVETPVENIDGGETRSDRHTIVEVTMLAGRGPERKRRLYDEIAKRLSHEPGIAAHDLVIVVNDPTGECFYLNGAIQCEVSERASEQENE